MTKKIQKKEAKNHLGDMKMNFLVAMSSGFAKHLKTPKGTIMYSRLNDNKKNDRFRAHIIDEFTKLSVNALDNINHEKVSGVAESFQNRFVKAAERQVNKVAKQGDNFDHRDLVSNTFDALDKVHEQLVNKL